MQLADSAGRDPIRLAVIGLGAMGNITLDVAAKHPEFTVVRAADLSPAAVEDARTRHPHVAFSTEPERVVTDPAVQAVYVATPPDTHAGLVVAAMAAGKAVFCEKPLAVSLADGRRMVAAAADSGQANAVNFSLSDRDSVLEVEQAVRSGAVGTVRGVDIRFSFPQWPRHFQAGARWLADRQQGGFVREVFSHLVYVTDRLLGPLEVVHSALDHAPGDTVGAEQGAHALLRAGDVPVHLSALAGVAAPEWYELTLWGTKRSYQLRNWSQLLVSEGGHWVPVELAGERGSEATRLSRFAAAVRGEDVAHLADFATALRVQQVVEAFHTGSHGG